MGLQISFSEGAGTDEIVLTDRIGCVRLRSVREAPVRRECRMRDAMGFDAFLAFLIRRKKNKVDLISSSQKVDINFFGRMNDL